MATKAYFKLLFSEDVFPPSGNVNTNYFIEPKIRPENQENVRGLPDQYSGFSVSNQVMVLSLLPLQRSPAPQSTDKIVYYLHISYTHLPLCLMQCKFMQIVRLCYLGNDKI